MTQDPNAPQQPGQSPQPGQSQPPPQMSQPPGYQAAPAQPGYPDASQAPAAYPAGAQPYPGDSHGQGTPGRDGHGPLTPPPPLALAVKLMYAGAALSVLGIVIALALQGQRTDLVLESSGMGEVGADSFGAFFTIAAVVGGLVGVVLWVVNAVFNAKGKKWARILSTVLAGLFVLSTLGSFAQPALPVDRVLAFVQLALAIGIVVLLWRPESSRFYQAASAPRY